MSDSYLESVIISTGAIIKTTFASNILPKSILAFFTTMTSLIVEGNEFYIGCIILLFLLNLFTGTASALINREFESKKFFMGCTKFLVYGIFMVIAVSLGEILKLGSIFLTGVLAFILISDSSSILENLEKIGFKTPLFLTKYLKKAQKDLDDKHK